MNEVILSETLEAFRSGDISLEETLDKLKSWPYEDLGFAKLDHHRAIRQGFPEVVFCQGKTIEQVVEIMDRLVSHNRNVLATRASSAMYEAVAKKIPTAQFNEMAKLIFVHQEDITVDGDRVVLVMTAGTSDIPVAEEAAVTAEVMGNKVERVYDVGVAGIHRLFAHQKLIDKANVIIVVAGMEGALASVVGGLTAKPLIAVPTSVGYGANFNGLSALLCMLNSCAAGIAVVNIDNGFGAGRLASIINHMR
ncbi:nickel pincer cofactor biosynthesis protein LarB [Dendrosporobacter sp. 1207_IL3150]|uniref:nickel pincer cofactor biosynthesis protein LarB n=1 Tax=Dendrosporobacter sp. 1207_IL3150 TaxID=3084054 RepID=UPI002FD9A0B8